MALSNPVLTDKMQYGGSSGSSGGYYHGGGGGYGYGSGSHVYSSVGHSGYGGYGGGTHEHHSSKGSKKSIALSALTLLAFLFFLHILQSCLENMDSSMTTTMAPTVVVMNTREAGRENYDIMTKRKGDVEDLDDMHLDENYAEKKSSTKNWEEMDKQVVTTRVKTFSKYDQPDSL